jgi:hypothetical protein
MIPRDLTLHYRLHPGWLAPFVEALQQGRALAHECLGCGRVSFPPLRVCACGAEQQRWRELSGRATVRFCCDGSDGRFGLVRFDGASTDTVARLDGACAAGSRAALVAAATDRPAIVLGAIAGGAPA